MIKKSGGSQYLLTNYSLHWKFWRIYVFVYEYYISKPSHRVVTCLQFVICYQQKKIGGKVQISQVGNHKIDKFSDKKVGESYFCNGLWLGGTWNYIAFVFIWNIGICKYEDFNSIVTLQTPVKTLANN